MISDSVIACPTCQTHIAPGLLACPTCRRLVHAQELTRLAVEARAAEGRNDAVEALTLWRQTLALLPPDTAQYQTIVTTIQRLSKTVDALPLKLRSSPKAQSGSASPTTGTAGKVGRFATLSVLAISILSKGKLLIYGLSNASLLLSMLASAGVYWALWGWKFAVGLILCIYVHEMGHVWMLRRYGIAATAPMFIPGLGAVVRLKQYPIDPREDARIGLAGPEWGLAASLICTAIGFALGSTTGGGAFLAIAKINAWINLFNLTPFGSLDGGRGFRALTRVHRIMVSIALIVAYGLSREGLLLLVIIVALYRTFLDPPPVEPNRGVLNRYLILIGLLTAISALHVSTQL